MRKRSVLAIVSIAIIMAVIVSTPAACSSGGGGGALGTSIATVGVSAILAGMSPGWAVHDDALGLAEGQTATTMLTLGGTAATFSQKITPEGDIVLATGQEVDRFIITGGMVASMPTVQLVASATTTAAKLTVEGYFYPWSGVGYDTAIDSSDGLPRFNRVYSVKFGEAEFSFAAANTPTVLTKVLNTWKNATYTWTFANAKINPGSQIRLRFKATGGTVVIYPKKAISSVDQFTKISYACGQLRNSTFILGQSLYEEADAAYTQTRNTAPTVHAQDDVYMLHQVYPDHYNFHVAKGQLVNYRVKLVDKWGNVAKDASIEFYADKAGTTDPALPVPGTPTTSATVASIGGYAGLSVKFTATPTQASHFMITAKVKGKQIETSWYVYVQDISTGFRPLDTYEVFRVATGSNNLLGTVSLTSSEIASTANVKGSGPATPTKTTLPEDIVYRFKPDSTAGKEAKWAIQFWARTRSLKTTDTARFKVRVEKKDGTKVAESATLEIKAGGHTQFFDVKLTPSGTGTIDFKGSPIFGGNDGFRVEVDIVASSNLTSTESGIELLIDPAVNMVSKVMFPGPVVFARGKNIGWFLASMPDPRK
ncbi:hypothetical protein ACFL59_15845 [Planctomycetota bacterium]